MPKESEFVHLHTHSHYSLLSALPKIGELVDSAVKYQMPALALTDNGNLYGAIEFYKECKRVGIKPIIGVDFYVAERTIHDKEANVDNRRSRLLLLAKDNEGYKNLIKLVTISHLEGFYYKPRIDKELIRKYSAGLIAISPSFGGKVWNLLRLNDKESAKKYLDEMIDIYRDDFYIEISHHPNLKDHGVTFEKVVSFSKENGAKLVAGHNIFYINPEDKTARNTMLSIQNNSDWTEKIGIEEEDFSFVSADQMAEYFKDIPEAIENTVKIANSCNLEIKLGTWVFPNLEIAKGTTYEAELRRETEKGLEKRRLTKTKEVEDRMEYELKIIIGKGFAPYFLVVADLLRFAKEKGILTNTRGSAAGSMVSYLMGITNVNPLEYKLPFERFLNPERPSAPDIDMDLADDRRDEVIEYARNKYGEDKVAQIGTFGKMMARGVVRDIARALGHPYGFADNIAKLIPFGSQGFPMTIDKALSTTPELKEIYEKNPDVKEIMDLGRKIEGCARHISVHAAGVVISPTALIDFVPLQLDPKGGKIITQYDMHSVEDAGLLKFDFLGIRNLAIIADAIKIVEKTTDEKIDIDKIPLDDEKTYQMLSRGETAETFQLNGAGMTKYLMDLKPTSIHDINAMIALYRPGPIEVIPEYIRRKNNPKLVSYIDPRMKKYLGDSYGLIVYQDDLLFSAIELAGYSWLEADKFRKAVGKKIPAEMAAQKERFARGVVENGQSKEFAEKMWKLFEPFQAYGFNKAHAASYGQIAYQTAYLKANYPIEYMTAVLTADSGDVEKITGIIKEAKRMGIDVLPPEINASLGNFTVVEEDGKKKIRFGLYSIKNFGRGIADIIIEERKSNGKFASLVDFLSRINDRNLNKKSLESLIKCGVLDSLEDRAKMIDGIEEILSFNKETSKNNDAQDSLFGGGQKAFEKLRLNSQAQISNEEKLSSEKELLGLYVSGHPLLKYKDKLQGKFPISKIKETMKEGMTCVVSGIIDDVKTILTKGGDKMAFVKISDFDDNIESVAFPRTYVENIKMFEPAKCVSVKGRYSFRNGLPSIVIDAIKEL